VRERIDYRMIIEIDNRNLDSALLIHRILYDAYLQEARLIGTSVFPPLQRTIEDFETCGNQFFAYRLDGVDSGIIETESVADVESSGKLIASLGVLPTAFRRGIGRSLVRHVLASSAGSVVVSTAEQNLPAIQLYRDLGFSVQRRYVTDDGFRIVQMRHPGP
jgi:GNAT superfamily N-acetyltransferase